MQNGQSSFWERIGLLIRSSAGAGRAARKSDSTNSKAAKSPTSVLSTCFEGLRKLANLPIGVRLGLSAAIIIGLIVFANTTSPTSKTKPDEFDHGYAEAVARLKVDPSDVHVSGHVRDNGTHVRDYFRTSRDGDPKNNYSTYPNRNPYTGQIGTHRGEVRIGTLLSSSSPYLIKTEQGETVTCEWAGDNYLFIQGVVVELTGPDGLGYGRMTALSGLSKGKSAKVRVRN